MLSLERPPYLTDLLTPQQREAVIARFYTKVYADPLLAPLFAGIRQDTQQQRLAGFIRKTRGRGNPFDAASLRGVHTRLGLTAAHFARREALLREALAEAGHGEEVVSCWMRFDALWWRHIRG